MSILTKDYSLFKSIEGNRLVNKRNVRDIIKSIEKNGYIGAYPILVNSNFEVIDGQHRLEACKELGIHVPYVVIVGGLKTVRDINSASRSWTFIDFINSEVQLGNKDILDLKEVFEMFNSEFPIGLVAGLVNGSRLSLRDIKGGKFKSKEKQETILFLTSISSLKDIIPKVYKRHAFVVAINSIIKNEPTFSFYKFKSNLEKLQHRNEYMLTSGMLTKFIKRRILDIHNYKSRNPIKY